MRQAQGRWARACPVGGDHVGIEDSAGRLRTGHSAPTIWTPVAAPVAGARAAVQAGRNSEKREERESSLWKRETEHLCVRKPMDDQMVY